MRDPKLDRPFHYNPPTEPYLDVIHHDDDILVVSKQSGLLSVPGRAENLADCLISRAQEQFPEARIIHRLDMDTSGVMVLGLSADAHRNISLQFEKRQTHKEYVAQIWGSLTDDEGLIDLPLRCDWPNRPMQMVDHELGKPSQTAWKVLSRSETTTTLKLSPKTGRTHQLRVHMRELGHPILGDDLYAHEEAYEAATRLMLHAETLAFTHPGTGQSVSYTAPCPF